MFRTFRARYAMKTWPHRSPLEMWPPFQVGGVARGDHCWVTDHLRCHKFHLDTPSSLEVMPAHGTSHIMPVYQRRQGCCINKCRSDVLFLTHSSSLSSHTFHFMFRFTISHTDIITVSRHLFHLLSVYLLSEPRKLPGRRSDIFVYNNTFVKIPVYRVWVHTVVCYREGVTIMVYHDKDMWSKYTDTVTKKQQKNTYNFSESRGCCW